MMKVVDFFKQHTFFKYFCIGLLVFSLIAGIFIATFISSFYDNQIEIVEVEGQSLEDVSDKIHKKDQLENEIYNILLVGVDARGYEENSRSDTIILASYNKTKHSVKLVSILRDTYLNIPTKGWDKVNAATSYGGVGMLVNTLNENFHLDIQYYVQIKFEDFKKVIDLMGGLDVELTNAEIKYINNKLHVEDKDYKNDITAEPGIVHLNGTQTLWHCRNRSIGNSDFTRTDRQREVLSLIIDNAMKLSVPQMSVFVYSMKDYVDMNVPLSLILSLGKDALITNEMTIESYRIPFDNEFTFANKRGASVISLDMKDTVVKLFDILELELPKDFKVVEEPVTNNRKQGNTNKKPVQKPVEKVEEPIEEVVEVPIEVETNTEGFEENTEVIDVDNIEDSENAFTESNEVEEVEVIDIDSELQEEETVEEDTSIVEKNFEETNSNVNVEVIDENVGEEVEYN